MEYVSHVRSTVDRYRGLETEHKPKPKLMSITGIKAYKLLCHGISVCQVKKKR